MKKITYTRLDAINNEWAEAEYIGYAYVKDGNLILTKTKIDDIDNDCTDKTIIAYGFWADITSETVETGDEN